MYIKPTAEETKAPRRGAFPVWLKIKLHFKLGFDFSTTAASPPSHTNTLSPWPHIWSTWEGNIWKESTTHTHTYTRRFRVILLHHWARYKRTDTPFVPCDYFYSDLFLNVDKDVAKFLEMCSSYSSSIWYRHSRCFRVTLISEGQNVVTGQHCLHHWEYFYRNHCRPIDSHWQDDL